MPSSRTKMMTAKQRAEKKQQTRTSSFEFVQTVWFPGTAPSQKGVQNCHSFEQRAAPRACALRCGIFIGVLTEAEVGLATSEPEFEDASACMLAGRCPLMPGRGGGEWTKQM